ncbi:MAG TPA: S49 family peptidase [Rhodopila sp.]|jgi:signal peptide peptidase SppA|nr:S49 family peptidase [Rhodopila sp.]
MNRLPFLSQRMFNTPVAIHPGKAEVIIAALADRLGVAHMFRTSGEPVALTPTALYDDDWGDSSSRESGKGYDVVEGVAVIQIAGTLVQKNGYLRPYSGMTGYDGIRQNLMAAIYDPKVEGIALDIDSPGGEVAGCFDLVDEIYGLRGEKPIWAILDEVAYSAAYAIASAADRILVPRTGGVGSIGVVCCHTDWSKALAGAGVKVTFIQYGDRKTDGAAEKPLSDEALERFQADIDAMGELFVETVARNRGMSAEEVRSTQAGTYLGREGVSLGLADDVMAPDAAFRELLSSLA